MTTQTTSCARCGAPWTGLRNTECAPVCFGCGAYLPEQASPTPVADALQRVEPGPGR